MLVNELIDSIEQGQAQASRNVSLQDNVRKYQENKENISNNIIEQVKKENLEMSYQPTGFSIVEDFDYDVRFATLRILLIFCI